MKRKKVGKKIVACPLTEAARAGIAQAFAARRR